MSLILNLPTIPESKIRRYLQSNKYNKIVSGLRTIIINLSQNKDMGEYMSLAIRVCASDKRLKKLFYLMIEQMKKIDNGKILAEMLLVFNFLRKDIESPNEYVRGRVMKLIEFIEIDDLLEIMYKPLCQNINHPNEYVRRNAVYSLSLIHNKYPDSVELIYKAMMMNKERQTFLSMWKIDKNRARDIFKLDVEFLRSDLLEVVIPVADIDFLVKCQKLEKLPFDTNITILKRNCDVEVKEIAIKTILEMIKENTQLRIVAIRELEPYVFELRGHGVEIMSLGETLEQFKLYADFAIKIAGVNELATIQEILSEKFQIDEFKVEVIKIFRKFSKLYEIDQAISDIMRSAIKDDNPEVVNEALNYISENDTSDEIDILISGLNTKYGKIFKFILSILGKKLEDPKVLIDFALKYAEENHEKFYGEDIAMTLSKIPGRDLEKEEVIQKLKQYYEVQHEILHNKTLSSENLDKFISSALILESMENIYDLCLNNQCESLDLVCKKDKILPYFTILDLKIPSEIIKRELPTVKIEQLTGMGDPLYCEARIYINNLDIKLELLFANQTSSVLHDISVDFSSPIAQKNVLSPFILRPRTLKILNCEFEMDEPTSCYITGTISFNFVQKGSRNLQSMILNLSDIHFRISDFLKPRSLTPEEFRNLWIELEWENAYSHKPGDISQIASLLNSEIIRNEIHDEYSISILSSVTLHGDPLLINISKEPSIMHFRIRGTKECLVKSVGVVIGQLINESLI